jgi:hypothetical protein
MNAHDCERRMKVDATRNEVGGVTVELYLDSEIVARRNQIKQIASENCGVEPLFVAALPNCAPQQDVELIPQEADRGIRAIPHSGALTLRNRIGAESAMKTCDTLAYVHDDAPVNASRKPPWVK